MVEEALDSTESVDEGVVEGEATTGPLEPPPLVAEGWAAAVLALPV